MVLLLVVGVAAVIIVILIAVFLSVRLGRGDDHQDHDEPAGRPSERGRGRLDDDDDDAGRRDTRALRRPEALAARPPRSGQRTRPQTQDPRYSDAGDRRPERDPAARPNNYDRQQRRPGHYGTGPQEQRTDPRRPWPPGRRGPGPAVTTAAAATAQAPAATGTRPRPGRMTPGNMTPGRCRARQPTISRPSRCTPRISRRVNSRPGPSPPPTSRPANSPHRRHIPRTLPRPGTG